MNANFIRTIIFYVFLSVFTFSCFSLISKSSFSAEGAYQEVQTKNAGMDNKNPNSAKNKSVKNLEDNEPPVGAIVVGIVSLLIGMGVLIWAYSVGQKGKEYGLNFIFSLNFFFLFANFLILFCFVLLHMPEIGLIVYALIWLFVFWRNARKSNYIFSLQYTLIQSISAILAIAFFVFFLSDDKAKRKIKVSKLLNS